MTTSVAHIPNTKLSKTSAMVSTGSAPAFKPFWNAY